MRQVVVGRDRAHVKGLISQFPRSEIITAKALFDRVRAFAFVNDPKLRRDDYAPLMLASNILAAKNSPHPLRLASHFTSLYSACFHGTKTPQDIWHDIKGKPYDFLSVFETVSAIGEGMDAASLVNDVSALYKAWQDIRRQRRLPLGFHCRDHFSLRFLVDLTLLEIEVIKDLSRLGIHFDICFPLDFHNRGINAAIEFAAKAFESQPDLINVDLSFENIAHPGPLAPLVESLFKEQQTVTLHHDQCTVQNPPDVIAEAELIASEIALLLTEHESVRVALAIRTLDARSKIYKHALMRHGINIRDRKGIPLPETQAGLLLTSLFSAKLWSLPRRDLIGLLNLPMFLLQVSDYEKRDSLMRLIRELNIDDRIIKEGSGRYEQALKDFQAFSEACGDGEDFSDGFRFFAEMESILELLPQNATFSSFLSSALVLMDKAFLNLDGSYQSLKDALLLLNSSACSIHDALTMSLAELIELTMAELAKITCPYGDVDDEYAVEVLLIPELLGREFDHVFIPDISFGRLPKNSAPDPLIDDETRLTLNKIYQKPVFRVMLEDPFEPSPVPPRQALEPLWFATAVASARQSVHFSYASYDESGTEQAPSEFFLWLADSVKLIDLGTKKAKIMPSSHLRFWQGVHDKVPEEQNDQSDSVRHIPHRLLEKGFLGKLSDGPSKVLTPTMVEAFAECRFKGFSKRVLMLEESYDDNNDIDARVIGQIAHRCLETYVKEEKHGGEISRQRLAAIIERTVKDYKKSKFIANTEVLSCHSQWLKDALFALLHNLSNSHKNIAVELAFGLTHSEWPPITINVNSRRYLLGGRVDRIDQWGDNFLIIDYKLSSTTSLRVDLSAKNILVRHFQMPIYARLVAEHLAKSEASKLSFAFASIRDGQLLSFDLHESPLLSRIFDDHGDDGLGKALDRILLPLLRGNIAAQIGGHCLRCDLNYFCRKAAGKIT